MSIKPLKQFGQHFLNDESIADRIIQSAGIKPSEPVWEIGPGQGVLTDRILDFTDDLTAFEIDNRLYELLQDKYDNRLDLINRDILAINWGKLLSEKATVTKQQIVFISNLQKPPHTLKSYYTATASTDCFVRACCLESDTPSSTHISDST